MSRAILESTKMVPITSAQQTLYHLGYRGASGGFLLLHLLLLSDNFFAAFTEQKDFKQILEDQWAIVDHTKWKQTEHWPDNFNTAMSDSHLDKIFYFCNPSEDDFFNYRKLFEQVKQGYSDIQDSSWPDINSFVEFDNLPDCIKREVTETLGYSNLLQLMTSSDICKRTIWLYTDIDSQNELAFYKKAYFYYQRPDLNKIQDYKNFTEVWQNDLVDRHAVYFLNNSDIQIRLQDLVNTPEILVSYGIVESINQNQINLLNHWKKLHPKELLKKIGIE